MNRLVTTDDVRREVQAAGAWFFENEARYSDEDRRLFRKLLVYAETPLHVCALGEELRRRMLPETQDRVASPPAHRTPGYSPAPSPSSQPTEATK
ncbi:MAG: hypothetical protein IH855_03240 [Bacteroidetes bacterium]|nr:hypothetical protein [Bacteroidota bacterium]